MNKNRLRPAYETNNIAICYYCNDVFVPYLGVSIQSLIKNSSMEFNYDILILQNNIQLERQEILKHISVGLENITIRFININNFLNTFERNSTNLPNISIDTYSRFLVFSNMFKHYSKMITIDADTLVVDNIAKLYQTDISNYPIGAVKEVIMEFMIRRNLHIPKYISNWHECPLRIYFKKLGITYENYFNAGILLLNLEICREKKIFGRFTKLIRKRINFYYEDQDILNLFFGKHYYHLSSRWNAAGPYPIMSSPIYASKKELPSDYLENLGNPGIIHFAGPINKPWRSLDSDYTDEFFYYAKESPWFRLILSDLVDNALPKKTTLFDVVFPLGTRRRGILRKHYYKIHDKINGWVS